MPINDEVPTGEELDRLLGADIPPTTTDQTTGDTNLPTGAEGVTTPTPPAGNPPVTGQATEQTGQQQWNPDGPGDPAKALAEKNREIAEHKQQLAKVQQQLETTQQILSNPQALIQYAAQMQAQQQQQDQKPQRVDLSVLEQLDPVTDPDGTFTVMKSLLTQQQQQLDELRAGITQTSHESRFSLARETARQRYPDYDTVVKRLEPFEHMLNTDVFLGPNGPDVAYNFAKTLPPLPGEQQAQSPTVPAGPSVEQQVQSQVTETAKRLLPTPPITPPTLSRMPAVAPNNDAKGDLASVTPEQIDKVGVHNWYDAAIRGAS